MTTVDAAWLVAVVLASFLLGVLLGAAWVLMLIERREQKRGMGWGRESDRVTDQRVTGNRGDRP